MATRDEFLGGYQQVGAGAVLTWDFSSVQPGNKLIIGCSTASVLNIRVGKTAAGITDPTTVNTTIQTGSLNIAIGASQPFQIALDRNISFVKILATATPTIQVSLLRAHVETKHPA
jgi:hypothetical protein